MVGSSGATGNGNGSSGSIWGKIFHSNSRRASAEIVLDELDSEPGEPSRARNSVDFSKLTGKTNRSRPLSLPFHIVEPVGSAKNNLNAAAYRRKGSLPEIVLGRGAAYPASTQPHPLSRMKSSPVLSAPAEEILSARRRSQNTETGLSLPKPPDETTAMSRGHSFDPNFQRHSILTTAEESESDLDSLQSDHGTVATDMTARPTLLSCPYIPQTRHLSDISADERDFVEDEKLSTLQSPWTSALLASIEEKVASPVLPPPLPSLDKGTGKVRIDITYCLSCGFLAHAHRTAHKLHVVGGSELLDFHFHPSQTPSGELEVYVNGKLIQSRLRGDGFSDKSSAVKRIMAAVKATKLTTAPATATA